MHRPDYSFVIILNTGFTILFFSGGSRFAFALMLKPMTDDLTWSQPPARHKVDKKGPAYYIIADTIQ